MLLTVSLKVCAVREAISWPDIWHFVLTSALEADWLDISSVKCIYPTAVFE